MKRGTTGILKVGDRFRVRWIDSRRKRRSQTFARESDAKAALNRHRSERDGVRSGRLREKADLTLASAAEQWLLTRPAGRKLDNSYHLERHILPALGHHTLTEITDVVIQRFIRRLEATKTSRKGEKNTTGRTLRPATIANVLITLRKLLNDHDYRLRISYKVPEQDYAWLKTPADVSRFLDHCGTGWFSMAAAIAVYAGLRKGEIAGLRWTSIDFERGYIRLERSYEKTTKSKRVRTVPLAPELGALLRRWRLHHGGDLVIRVRGAMLGRHEDTAKRTRAACKRAGVESVKFHELRATYASHLAERVSLPMIGAVLGHVDPKTTARYCHVDTDSLARDPRFHLSFAVPAAEVLPLHGAAPDRDGPGMDRASVTGDR